MTAGQVDGRYCMVADEGKVRSGLRLGAGFRLSIGGQSSGGLPAQGGAVLYGAGWAPWRLDVSAFRGTTVVGAWSLGKIASLERRVVIHVVVFHGVLRNTDRNVRG